MTRNLKNISIQNNLYKLIGGEDGVVKKSFFQGIKEGISSFLKSDFYIFFKSYFYFVILFTLCFYAILYVNSSTKNKTIIVETKVFFYISIMLLFIIVNDILETPLESLYNFLLNIIYSLIFIYIISHIITYYYKGELYFSKFKLIMIISLIIFLSTSIYLYYNYQVKNPKVAVELFSAFSYAMNKNFGFLLFLTIYLIIYRSTFVSLDLNSSLSDILAPTVLGGLLIFFIFCLIIYICSKLKIINKIQILNSFISLSSIVFFLVLIGINTFMASMGEVCANKNEVEEEEKKNGSKEIVILLMIASIFIILWLDDSRNWHQIGSILFILATVMAFYCMFYYSTKYPDTSILALWLFIEWCILAGYRKENTKNSIHFSFMKT
jgi:hypothetical protein